ncbi:30S ribosomal protein S6 [Patescibacteria group bacterium]|nr:MAG: 30S ribosomal protein S6 [Patescibacteria group bacterium]
MTPYELVYIIPARVKEPARTKSSILNIIKEKGGEIWTEIDFGKRRLTYAIDHARNGEFVGVEFQAEGLKIDQIKSTLNVFDDIARFQISQIKKLSDKDNLKTDILRSEITGRPALGEARSERLEMAKPEMIKVESFTRPEAVKEMEAKPMAEAAIIEQPSESKVSEASAPIIETPAAESEKPAHKKDTKTAKVSLEELDKKLEELLDEEVK